MDFQPVNSTRGTCNGLLVVSDLDGTLLDHETYDWSPARPALHALRREGHGLILASSKTAVEIAPIRRAIGFEDFPAIVENGAGILLAGDSKGRIAGKVHARILAALANLPGELRSGFSGFSQWSVAELAQRTGLPTDQARLAAQRQFSEPGIWHGSAQELAEFRALLAKQGITARMGGRFLTLGPGASKAERMMELAAVHRKSDPGLVVIALGDAPNDMEMLEQAGRGYIIRNPAHGGVPALPGESGGRIRRSHLAGPAGWNNCVLAAIKEVASSRQETGRQETDG